MNSTDREFCNFCESVSPNLAVILLAALGALRLD
jgi:hypothetical protein